MALRCWPGALAVVIEGDCRGLFVTVLERCDDHPRTKEASWFCRISGDCPVTLVDAYTGRILARRIKHRGDTVAFTDNELWPIRPPPTPKAAPAPSRELELTS